MPSKTPIFKSTKSMTQAISPSSIHRSRIRSPSPSTTYQRSPSPSSTRTRQSSRLANKPALDKRRSSHSKENESPVNESHESSTPSGQNGNANTNGMETLIPAPKPQQHQTKMNGRAPSEEKEMMNGNVRSRRDGSIDEDDVSAAGPSSTIRARRSQTSQTQGSGTTPKRQSSQQSAYNGLPTLPTIGDDDDGSAFLPSGPPSPSSPGPGTGRAPPPAPSAQAASDPRYGELAGSGVRRRRASSIKRKLSPGVTPTKAVDWEIPRKAFHSSIGKSSLRVKWSFPFFFP